MKKSTDPTPELVGTFSFEKNGTPVLQIIDSIVAGKKVKYLKLPNRKNYFFLENYYSKVSGGKSLENTKLVNFKAKNDWLHSVADFYIPMQIYPFETDTFTILSLDKKIKISNKLRKDSYQIIKKHYPQSMVNEFEKEMYKSYVFYTKIKKNIRFIQLYITNKIVKFQTLYYEKIYKNVCGFTIEYSSITRSNDSESSNSFSFINNF